MKEKNRFSILLEHLVDVAEVKHYVLAQSVQFDVSYISKWISGRVLPTEKTASDTIQKISQCLASNASDNGRLQLMRDYQLSNPRDLWQAIYDNLIDEYYYVLDSQQNNENAVTSDIAYFPELSIKKFLTKMHHPVLRRVKDLNVMAAMDLFSMDNEYRMQIININEDRNDRAVYSNVHFSLLVDVRKANKNVVENTLFLTNILLQMTRVNFSLYRAEFAQGKVMFVVRDDFAISGMLIRRDACASVVVCEGKTNTLPLYSVIQSFCTRDALLFRRCEMEEMLRGNMDYMHTLLTPDRCWMLSHVTEHVIPDDLYADLMERSSLLKNGHTRAELTKLREVTKGIVRKGNIRVLISEAGLSRFAITGEIDFFNEKFTLDTEQRIRVIQRNQEIVRRAGTMKIRMVQGDLVDDFQYHTLPTLFLAHNISYLRLEAPEGEKNLLLKINSQDMFQNFFETVWKGPKNIVSDIDAIDEFYSHLLHGLQLMLEIDREVT